MMVTDNPDKREKAERLQQKLAKLRRSYVQTFPDKCKHLDALFQSCLSSCDEASLQLLRQSVHKLKGSGATYGFEHISASAMVLELRLARLLQTPPPFAQDELVGMEQELTQLKATMANVILDEPDLC